MLSVLRVCVATIFVSFGTAYGLSSFAQMTVGEAIEAEKRTAFAQHQQLDVQFAGSCFMMPTALSGFPSMLQRTVTEKADKGDPVFWQTYLERLGASETDIATLSSNANAMAGNIGSIDDSNVTQLVAQFQTRLNQCAEFQAMLSAQQCTSSEAGTAPPKTHIPAQGIELARICRELVASKSRDEPASFVQEDPERLAEYNARKAEERAELAFFDELLASQPTPQCASDFKDGVCFMGCTGGVQAFGEAYDAVKQARSAFRQSTATSDWSNEEMFQRNKLDLVKWEGECADFKLVTNYPVAAE